MHIRFAPLFFLLLFFLFKDVSVFGNTGSVHRPFPVIYEIDYPLCRAKAWLNAAIALARQLPASIKNQLPVPGLTSAITAASLLHPVEAVTPQISFGDEIKVYLKNNQDAGSSIADMESFILHSALILETQEQIKNLENLWPKNLREADKNLPALEKSAKMLDGLWLAKDSLNSPQNMNTLLNYDFADSILLTIFKAEKERQGQFHQKALNNALKAENMAEKKIYTDPYNKTVWNYLAAKAAFIQGNVHEYLAQNALAEASYTKAINILQNTLPQADFLIRLLNARAKLNENNGNIFEMCEDYRRACAIGDCTKLVKKKWQGICPGL